MFKRVNPQMKKVIAVSLLPTRYEDEKRFPVKPNLKGSEKFINSIVMKAFNALREKVDSELFSSNEECGS